MATPLDILLSLSDSGNHHLSLARCCVLLQITPEVLVKKLAERGAKVSLAIDDQIYFSSGDIHNLAKALDTADAVVGKTYAKKMAEAN